MTSLNREYKPLTCNSFHARFSGTLFHLQDQDKNKFYWFEAHWGCNFIQVLSKMTSLNTKVLEIFQCTIWYLSGKLDECTSNPYKRETLSITKNFPLKLINQKYFVNNYKILVVQHRAQTFWSAETNKRRRYLKQSLLTV